MDAGLLQMSRCDGDGWYDKSRGSKFKREAFRKFLVDAHKAAYIPIYIAGETVNPLTLEPAKAITLESDLSGER